MSSILAMFPGQGSQYVGMGREAFSVFPAIFKPTFEEASDAIHVDLRKLCLEGPEDALRQTANTQPCIVASSVAAWRVMREETGITPTHFAGHSLGEYSALVASEKLAFGDAIRLVRRRGEAMQSAVPEGVGGMAAVMSVAPGELERRCAEISHEGSQVVIANYNSPQQLVVSGHLSALQKLCGQLETDGFRSVQLPVSAPFHSPLMAPARAVMEPLLRAVRWTSNKNSVIPNRTGKPTTEYTADLLIEQIDHPVLWIQTIESVYATQCTRYLEVGPGKVLLGLVRRVLPRGVELIATDDLREGIDKTRALTSSSPSA
jgi:[acyl-carrier-protein] S-malonyltransferase